MFNLHQIHRSDNSGVGPSGAIWADLPFNITDPNVGVHVFENFLSFGGLLASTTGHYSGDAGHYLSYQDTSDVISQDPTFIGGVLKMAIASTNNNESWIQSCGGTGVLGKIASAGNVRKLWFETRVRFAGIVTQNWFSGLTEEGLAAADTQADSGGAMASKDYIGFRITEDAASAVDLVYRKAGQSEVEVLAAAQTIVADTWYKFGFVVDPDVPAAQRIRFYIDGTKQSSYVAHSALDDATFPDGEELAWLFGGKNNNAANTHYCDWFRFAQLY